MGKTCQSASKGHLTDPARGEGFENLSTRKKNGECGAQQKKGKKKKKSWT